MEHLDGVKLKELIVACAAYLDANRQSVDALNVFPVPDGDTGTNMALTMLAAAREVEKVSDTSLPQIARALTTGSLMGARGNSGVILSQLFRGFTRKLAGKDYLRTSDMAEAMQEGVNTAYRAVMKPVEGTILTVAREAAVAAQAAAREEGDVVAFLQTVLRQAQISLEKTPSLLPVLKQAGVVDAGGKGLVLLLEGALLFLQGISPDQRSEEVRSALIPPVTTLPEEATDLIYPYCTELLLTVGDQGLSEDSVRDRLSQLGDSLLVVGADVWLKIHVHTADPGMVLSYCRQLGEMRDIKIDNMRYQHRNLHTAALGEGTAEEISRTPAARPGPEYGIVAVAVGDGIAGIFSSLGVEAVVRGGQTMNPSTEDIARAVQETPGGRVIILPNNSNIIMAAQQVKELTKKEITVVPTRSIPEGIAAVLAFDAALAAPENAQKMEAAARCVQTGEVTYAVRDSQGNGVAVQAGDIIGLWDREIRVSGKTPGAVTADLLALMVTEEASLITLYYGAGVPEEAARDLAAEVTAAFGHCSVEVYHGGQPLYYYLVSVE